MGPLRLAFQVQHYITCNVDSDDLREFNVASTTLWGVSGTFPSCRLTSEYPGSIAFEIDPVAANSSACRVLVPRQVSARS
jgi:hypothetical protein